MKIIFAYDVSDIIFGLDKAVRVDGYVNGIQVGGISKLRFFDNRENAVRSAVINAIVKGIADIDPKEL